MGFEISDLGGSSFCAARCLDWDVRVGSASWRRSRFRWRCWRAWLRVAVALADFVDAFGEGVVAVLALAGFGAVAGLLGGLLLAFELVDLAEEGLEAGEEAAVVVPESG